MELINLFITSIFSLLSGATATFVFFKARRKKEYAEAENQDIANFRLMQEAYQVTISDLKNEVRELREKYFALEKQMNIMCEKCPYKTIYDKKK